MTQLQTLEHPTFKIKHYQISASLATCLLNEAATFFEAMKAAITEHFETKGEKEFVKLLKRHLEIEIYDLPPVKRLDRTMLDRFVALGPCQVHAIEPLQHIKSRVVYRCWHCGELSRTKSKCEQCEEKDLEEEVAADNLQDQRYIEVILDQQGMATDKSLKYWLDIRGEKAFETPDFGETWIVSGFVRLSKNQDRQPIGNTATFFLYLEVNTIQKVATATKDKVAVTPELVAARKKWVSKCLQEKKDVEAELVAKLAPSIVGEDLLKLSLLRQAVSGAVENVGERTDIHILVLRNPGRAKTDLAMYMSALTGGGYVDSAGASAVGLVVGLENDERTKKKVAKAGAAILFNKLPIYFDEVDKIKREYLSQLNTPLDKGFYQETKILNKRFETASPWAAFGNFKSKKYDPKQSLAWNINLPEDFLDRIDLYHIDPAATYDEDLENAIMDAQSDRFEKGVGKIVIDQELREHIACARSIKQIKFEPNVRDVFKTFQKDMKRLEQALDSGIKFSNRQFNGLWRQAIARAVLHLRDTVTKEDAEKAILHVTTIIGKIGIDPRTGEVDLGILTGSQKSKQDLLKAFKSIFLFLCNGDRYADISRDRLIEQLQKQGWIKNVYEASELIEEAKKQRMIMETSRDNFRWIRG